MDPKDLKRLETMCVQEEPPFCTAACPVHLDVRGFIKHIGMGNWKAAREILDKTLPFSGILARICDHPCQAMCRLGQAGDAIAIHDLEHTCVRTTGPALPAFLKLKKDHRIAIIGGGLSSLTAAWDLGRKGYGITVFEHTDRMGGELHTLSEGILPAEVMDDAAEVLKRLGANFRFNVRPTPDLLTMASGEFEAVYVGLDSGIEETFGLQIDETGQPEVDPLTFLTGMQGVFAGGFIRKEGKRSWITDAAEGRWAGVSIDRYIKKVSLTAARENQGPLATRLYTRIDETGYTPSIPMADPENGYTPDEAVLEAGRCLQCECRECVKACPYLDHFGGYPKTYTRDMYNSEKVVWGTRPANKLINSCTLCGLCKEICPENFSMADLCRSQRAGLVAKGKMPLSAHEFALDDMRFSNSEKAALIRAEPGKDKSRYLFFPGCQLSASSPSHVVHVYNYLRQKLDGGVGLALRCCGIPADWAARKDLFRDTIREFLRGWEAIGRPCVITGCSGCLTLFKEHLKEISTISLWEVLEEKGLPGSGSHISHASSIAIHDPCTARHEYKMQESVRNILFSLGYEIEELRFGRNFTKCCGFGGLTANANHALAKEMAKKRGEESIADFVAYCAMCRDSLSSSGKRVAHILDLIWEQDPAADPFDRKGPGYSLRRENRARLKNRLMKEVWGEPVGEPEEYERLELQISTDVLEKMEQRRILIEDVQKVIRHAEEMGNRFVNPKKNTFLACYSPVQVTFWVEYSRSDTAFVVHNAYSHRMKIVGGRNT